jgi:hypothetical protein
MLKPLSYAPYWVSFSSLPVSVSFVQQKNLGNNNPAQKRLSFKPMETVFDKTLSGTVRAEYIEVEPNVRLHITDAGEGRPIVLLPGWPLSDEMYEYQYNDLINNNFRVIGITLRGFGKSDKPYGAYNYNVHVLDIRKILGKLDVMDAVLGGFSMGEPLRL